MFEGLEAIHARYVGEHLVVAEKISFLINVVIGDCLIGGCDKNN